MSSNFIKIRVIHHFNKSLNLVLDEYMEMEWMEFEQKEYEEVTRLMDQLELEFGGKRKEFECTGARIIMMNDVDMRTENEDVNEVSEQTILDEWWMRLVLRMIVDAVIN